MRIAVHDIDNNNDHDNRNICLINVNVSALSTRFSMTIFYHIFRIVSSISKSIPCFIRVLLFALVM